MPTKRFWVKVRTGQRAASVEEAGDGSYVASVRAQPEHGKANDELRRLLSIHFDCPRSRVRIISGLTSRRKLVELAG